MNKQDLQRLFNEIKANKYKAAAKNKDLFSQQVKKGCTSCGKVKWKPKKNT